MSALPECVFVMVLISSFDTIGLLILAIIFFKRSVLRSFINILNELDLCSPLDNWFHSAGPPTLKLLSAKVFALVFGMSNLLMSFDECRFLPLTS